MMRALAEKKGLVWASISILILVLVLFIMASISGGFAGLSGTSESLVYAGIVEVPLVVVVLLALRKPINATKKEETVFARIAVND